LPPVDLLITNLTIKALLNGLSSNADNRNAPLLDLTSPDISHADC